MLPKAVAVAMAVALCALVVIMLGAPGSLSRAVAATGTLGSRYGAVDSHFKLHNGSTMDRELSDLAAAGVKSLRFDFAWADLEPARDAWNFAQADLAVAKAQSYGIQVLGILGACPTWANGNRPFNYPPTDIEAWKNYVSNVCTRYKGQVTAWEIWNEENIHGFWLPSPDANAYVALVKQTTPQIRAADPAATVVMGGVAGLDPNYLDNCFKAGVADYVDAVAYHPYPEALTFMNYTPQESNCRYIVSWLRWLISTYTTKPIQIWLTEFGWTSCQVDEQTQASYTMRTMINYAGLAVDRVFYFNLYDEHNSSTDPESNYGLLANNFRRKPVYGYYDTFCHIFGGSVSIDTTSVSFSCSSPNSLEAHCFKLEGGDLAIGVWKSDDKADSVNVTVKNPGYAQSLTVNPLTGQEQPTAGAVRGSDGKITISGLAVGKDPVVLRLKIPATQGNITATVTGSAGSPVQGCRVEAYDQVSGALRATATTDASGHCRVSEVPAGLYRLRFDDTSGSYGDEFYHDSSTIGSAVSVNVAGGENIVVTEDLEPAAPKPPSPVLASVNPTSGRAGTVVSVKGSGFGSSRGGSLVYFGSTKATSYVSWSNSLVKVKVPSSASKAVAVKVVTAAGTSNSKSFKVTPKISALSSRMVSAGSWVTVAGAGFGGSRGGSYVKFGSQKSTICANWTKTKFKVKVPSGVSGSVTVRAVIMSAGSSNGVTCKVN